MLFVIAHEDRSEMFTRSLRRSVSADDEFLLADTFELDPCSASAAGFVNRLALLADKSFEAAPLHFIEQLFCVSADRARITDRIAGARAELFENILARLQWQRDQALAIQLKQVKCIEINGTLSPFHLPRLQELKRGTALLVERNHFAINHAFACRQILHRFDDFREPSGQFIFVSRKE